MDANDLFEHCAKVADLAFSSFNARREHQWRISLGLWTLILVTTRFFTEKQFVSLGPPAGITVFVVLFHALFVCGVWRKSAYDERTHYYFREKCIAILGGRQFDDTCPPLPISMRGSWGFIRDGSSLFQIGTTLALSTICVLYLSS
jgi:hypothetical protein